MKLLPPSVSRGRRTSARFATHVESLAPLVGKTLLACATTKEIATVLRTLRDEKVGVTRLCTPRGRAKGGGQSSKAKGRSAVVRVRDLLQTTFDLEPDDVFVKATSQGGCDIHMSPHAQAYFPFAIEIKNVEKLALWSALAQATVNAKKKNVPPVVFFKRSHSPLYVAFVAEDLLKFLRPK
jgi:hypothetical protein